MNLPSMLTFSLVAGAGEGGFAADFAGEEGVGGGALGARGEAREGRLFAFTPARALPNRGLLAFGRGRWGVENVGAAVSPSVDRPPILDAREATAGDSAGWDEHGEGSDDDDNEGMNDLQVAGDAAGLADAESGIGLGM
jgi:hypothetical protein